MTPVQKADYEYHKNRCVLLQETNDKLSKQVRTLQEQVSYWKRKANAKK